MKYLLACLVGLFLLFPSYAMADAQKDIAAAESYLRGISTYKARFIQTSNSGDQAAGDFLLKRPGRLKFTYDAPIEDFIVADGVFVYYYDGQLKEQSSAPISQSLADFFLRADLRLSGDIQVQGVRREAGFLLLTLVQKEDPSAGSLTLAFNENPMQLKKWRVVDAQGAVTEVELFDVTAGIKLDNDLFHYYDPKRGQRNLNR